MWSNIRLLCLVLAPVAVQANATPSPPSGVTHLAQAGGAAFDGPWEGRGTLVSVSGRGTACGGPSIGHRLTVQGGNLTIEYSPPNGIRFAGLVAADGKFDLYAGSAHFFGQFTGGTMAATFSSQACERSWRFRRQTSG